MTKFQMPIDGWITIEAENKDKALEWIEEKGEHGKAELVAEGLVKKVKEG